MSGFTRFSELAQELQDQIWDMAIRDDEPAAQFFTIHETYRLRDWTTGEYLVSLRSPYPSWVDGNKSAYMTDSGLWTACWGSRARMLQRFKPAETSALMSRLAPVTPQEAQKICRRPTASVTMPFKRGGTSSSERNCYLTIKPMEDLLYFEVDSGALAHADHYYWKVLQDIPAFRWKLPHDGTRTRGGWHAPLHARHIAVAYDPDWQHSHSYFEDRMRPRAGDIAGLEVFWLVDYALRRTFRVNFESSRRDRRTFRAGDDHEFVEVLETDDEWWDGWRGLSWNRGPGLVRGRGKSDGEVHVLAAKMKSEMLFDVLVAEMEAVDVWRTEQQSNIANNPGDDDDDPRDDGDGDGDGDGPGGENHSISLDFAGEEDAHTGSDATARRTPCHFGVLAYVKRRSERDLPTRHEWLEKNHLSGLGG